MSQPIRVLHIFGRMNRGGAETFIMHVYRHIDRQKVQFDFAVHSPLPGHYDDEIRQLGGRIFILPRPRLRGIVTYEQALKRILQIEGPFAVVHSHVHFFSGIPLAVAAQAGIPCRIAHSHNTHDGRGNSLFRQFYRWYMRRLIDRHTTHMLGCSCPACEALYGSGCWQDQRVRVVHYGIDLTPFESLPPDRRALRRKFGFPEDAPLIGHVGRFDVQKNHRFLIEVFEALLSPLPAARLILVGDGPLKPEIEELVAAKGIQDRVLFMGVRPDVPEILGCLDAFLFPSLWEGLGIVLIEAQAAGVPCVVSNVISEEANLGIGLLHPVSLNASLDQWVEQVLRALRSNRPDWEVRKNALQRNGYDVREAVAWLEECYVNCSKCQ